MVVLAGTMHQKQSELNPLGSAFHAMWKWLSITQRLLSSRKTPTNALFWSCGNCCHTENLPSMHCFDHARTAVIQKNSHQCAVLIMQELLSYRKTPISALFWSCKNCCHTEKLPSVHCFDHARTAVIHFYFTEKLPSVPPLKGGWGCLMLPSSFLESQGCHLIPHSCHLSPLAFSVIFLY